jgi:hypothetical protein
MLCNERDRRFRPLGLGMVALAIVMAGMGAESQSTAASGMSKYIDTGFGYSFWYPTAWTVIQEPVDDPADRGWFQGGTIVRRLRINEFSEDGALSSVVVEELSAPRGFLIVLGAHSANPVGADQKFFFDQRTQTWMDALLSKPTDGGHRSTSPAALCGKTMGGPPILCGAGRGVDVIVPIDPKHLLVLTTMDSDRYEEYIAETIMVNEAGSGGRTSAEVQEDIIHRKALKLGAVGQSVGISIRTTSTCTAAKGRFSPASAQSRFPVCRRTGRTLVSRRTVSTCTTAMARRFRERTLRRLWRPAWRRPRMHTTRMTGATTS